MPSSRRCHRRPQEQHSRTISGAAPPDVVGEEQPRAAVLVASGPRSIHGDSSVLRLGCLTPNRRACGAGANNYRTPCRGLYWTPFSKRHPFQLWSRKMQETCQRLAYQDVCSGSRVDRRVSSIVRMATSNRRERLSCGFRRIGRKEERQRAVVRAGSGNVRWTPSTPATP